MYGNVFTNTGVPTDTGVTLPGMNTRGQQTMMRHGCVFRDTHCQLCCSTESSDRPMKQQQQTHQQRRQPLTKNGVLALVWCIGMVYWNGSQSHHEAQDCTRECTRHHGVEGPLGKKKHIRSLNARGSLKKPASRHAQDVEAAGHDGSALLHALPILLVVRAILVLLRHISAMESSGGSPSSTDEAVRTMPSMSA
jgi:hypothetical protein